MMVSQATAYGALLISILCTVASQILQKQVADNVAMAPQRSALPPYLHEPRFWLSLLCLGGAMLSWLLVLTTLEVSKAYSLLSVNYVLVLLVSRFWFREAVPFNRWLGVFCLLAGVFLIVRS